MTGKKVNGITSFEHKWGYHVKELAESELIKPEALHMRVRNFGSPFQRKPKPSYCELMYGKTIREKAEELNIHPTALDQRLRLRGTAYHTSAYQHMLGRKLPGRKDWRDELSAQKPQGWLHADHPWHKMWRIYIVRQLLSGMTIEQAVEKMLKTENSYEEE
jgi:hypothetical protein|tara:strand:+ start:553 stop:1035 length:483 start_codon:yes stop_codon:yes gene_type:complete